LIRLFHWLRSGDIVKVRYWSERGMGILPMDNTAGLAVPLKQAEHGHGVSCSGFG